MNDDTFSQNLFEVRCEYPNHRSDGSGQPRRRKERGEQSYRITLRTLRLCASAPLRTLRYILDL